MACPLCEGTKIYTDYDSGEQVCTVCGCVVNDPPLSYGERPYFGEYDKRRYGSPPLNYIYDKGTSTTFHGDKDAYGSKIPLDKMDELRRLRRHDTQSRLNDSAMRNLNVAMGELDRIVTGLNLPDTVKETAAHIYRKALDEDLIRGRSIDAFVAASIYAACRLLRVPRPLSLVSDVSKREYQEVSMTYRLIHKELGIKPPIDDGRRYIPNIANKVGAPRMVERLAVDILGKAEHTGETVGKDPRGLAAGALYLASVLLGCRLVQTNVAKAAGTTGITLRNRYRGLKRVLLFTSYL